MLRPSGLVFGRRKLIEQKISNNVARECDVKAYKELTDD